MKPSALVTSGGSAFLGLCVSLAIANATAAQVPDKTPAPNTELQLRFSLRREASGEVRLHLDMPVNETTLRLLLNGSASKQKLPTFLTAETGISYGEVVKVIDMLGSLGIQKISLDTKHSKPSP